MSAMLRDAVAVRAAVYRLLAIGFGYPDASLRTSMTALADAIEPWAARLLPVWTGQVHAVRTALEQSTDAELEAEFNVHFSGAMACPPHETAYERDIFRRQHVLADIAGFYRAFGCEVPPGTRWQQDHIGVQLEFCALVLELTGRAIEEERPEEVATCEAALRSFLEDHTGRWAAAFAADLRAASTLPFYRELAGLTADWLELECTALELRPDPLRARYTPVDDAGLPSCPGCTDCPADGPIAACPLMPLASPAAGSRDGRTVPSV
jgi:TorA maturation chaperone TorD